jgi:hypothetical protein
VYAFREQSLTLEHVGPYVAGWRDYPEPLRFLKSGGRNTLPPTDPNSKAAIAVADYAGQVVVEDLLDRGTIQNPRSNHYYIAGLVALELRKKYPELFSVSCPDVRMRGGQEQFVISICLPDGAMSIMACQSYKDPEVYHVYFSLVLMAGSRSGPCAGMGWDYLEHEIQTLYE